MMDGMVAAIRAGLDKAGYSGLPIMSYAVKYASSFYGPFRDAADGAPKFGDRKSTRWTPPTCREALREAALDVAEGADFLMVKPALPYLDVIAAVRSSSPNCRWRPTTSAANTPCSKPPPPTAGWTNETPCWKRFSASNAPARI
jgi:delta-aminolevulinic acid dehydratase/porphobilinogen synthase